MVRLSKRGQKPANSTETSTVQATKLTHVFYKVKNWSRTRETQTNLFFLVLYVQQEDLWTMRNNDEDDIPSVWLKVVPATRNKSWLYKHALQTGRNWFSSKKQSKYTHRPFKYKLLYLIRNVQKYSKYRLTQNTF